MSADPALVELARRGDLALVRSTVTGRVGVLRYDVGGNINPVWAFDRGEWRWLMFCAAPVALRELGTEPDYRNESTGPLSSA